MEDLHEAVKNVGKPEGGHAPDQPPTQLRHEAPGVLELRVRHVDVALEDPFKRQPAERKGRIPSGKHLAVPPLTSCPSRAGQGMVSLEEGVCLAAVDIRPCRRPLHNLEDCLQERRFNYQLLVTRGEGLAPEALKGF